MSKRNSIKKRKAGGFCRRCNKNVYLNESLVEIRDGRVQVRGDCVICSGYVKFIPYKQSSLIKEVNIENNLEVTVVS